MTTVSDISSLLLAKNLQYMLKIVDLWYKRGKAKLFFASPWDIEIMELLGHCKGGTSWLRNYDWSTLDNFR